MCLLWADDLVLLALNKESLQNLLNVLHEYCVEWGLTVNMKKTAIMVFNKAGRTLKCSKGLMFGEQEIPSLSSYCYLGITFTLAGSYKKAALELRHKANRGYYALRKIIDWKFLKRSTIIKLFYSLIKPITMYGCPIWIPYIIGNTLCTPWVDGVLSEQQTASLFAKAPCEQLHLSFLKWNLGTHKRTNNYTIWGDTGRYPLVIQAIKQCIKYYDRLADMDNSNNMVEHAFAEQQKGILPWYSKMAKIVEFWQPDRDTKISIGSKIKKDMLLSFNMLWKNCCKTSTKLKFYSRIRSRSIPSNDSGTIRIGETLNPHSNVIPLTQHRNWEIPELASS